MGRDDEREDKNGYTPSELLTTMDIVPKFRCPHCLESSWINQTMLRTTPTKLWMASTPCGNCEKSVRWLLDPDKTVEFQTDTMHRPIGF